MVAAVASYLDARASGGAWLVRMEDVDRPRCRPGAASEILRQLEAHGLEWDGEVVYQSQRGDAYQAALKQLGGAVFDCACTRQESERCGCRLGIAPGRKARAKRVVGAVGEVSFLDRLQGEYKSCVGDFIVKRADSCWAYQLAVVVDDAWQGITDVVRGADLLESTPRQLHLQRLLSLPQPRYLHVPVVLAPDGRKLSKQNRSQPVEASRARETIASVLRLLSFDPPDAALPDLLDWAIAAWNEGRLPPVRARIMK